MNVTDKAADIDRQIRMQKQAEWKKAKAAADRQNYAVGKLVCSCFPIIRRLKPGTEEETKLRFAGLEAIFVELAADPEFCARLEKAINASPAGDT